MPNTIMPNFGALILSIDQFFGDSDIGIHPQAIDDNAGVVYAPPAEAEEVDAWIEPLLIFPVPAADAEVKRVYRETSAYMKDFNPRFTDDADYPHRWLELQGNLFSMAADASSAGGMFSPTTAPETPSVVILTGQTVSHEFLAMRVFTHTPREVDPKGDVDELHRQAMEGNAFATNLAMNARLLAAIDMAGHHGRFEQESVLELLMGASSFATISERFSDAALLTELAASGWRALGHADRFAEASAQAAGAWFFLSQLLPPSEMGRIGPALQRMIISHAILNGHLGGSHGVTRYYLARAQQASAMMMSAEGRHRDAAYETLRSARNMLATRRDASSDWPLDVESIGDVVLKLIVDAAGELECVPSVSPTECRAMTALIAQARQLFPKKK